VNDRPTNNKILDYVMNFRTLFVCQEANSSRCHYSNYRLTELDTDNLTAGYY